MERHYGEEDGNGENVMNPQTIVHLKEGAHMEMETTQIKGIDSTVRITQRRSCRRASLEVHGEDHDTRKTVMPRQILAIDMNGKTAAVIWCHCSVAKGESDRILLLL